MRQAALLALADGSLFHGESIGVDGQCCGEVVFNTSMTGYQEILTDPSYCRQIVTLTYPHIGNVGINIEDEESSQVFVAGLIIRDLPLLESNWRTELSLADYLKQHKVVSIAEIDTRRLTRILREKGAQNGCLVAGENIDPEAAIQAAKNFAGLQGMDLAKEVSAQQPYEWKESVWSMDDNANAPSKQWQVIAYDFGVKRNILRLLIDRGCSVTVVPAQTPASEILKHKPDGVFLSNGPGDPEPCDYAVTAIKEILEQGTPLFGICLGHQLLGLASGAKTVKMKFGHHGANHPVQEINSGKVMITSQNHGFALDEESLPTNLQPTHRSLFDGSLQGIRHIDKPAFSFQGHPEASPGPHDVADLFDQFIDLMKNNS
ncbi:glutamine-hydrolyzing carbamoyl-phosphate synthase small subunit [Candidatus Halobeggiatoa sp. HSG11]|nr:glutamine-hydrolyzing carbamoyl-phosphate synthase small subunit [Candidatus Halobeggiatoa sp. HSG11]